MKIMYSPRHIDIDITNNCNLRCSYCYHFTSAGDTGTDVSLEEWLQFFKELKQYSVLSVGLGGGEPLFRSDFKELVDGVVENGMRFSIISNGTLINDDIVDCLKSTKRCSSFQVSLDGPGPEENDICRGKGAFEKALAGINCLIKNDIPTTVRVTIHRHNFKSLDRIAKLLLEDVGLPSFSTNNAGHLGLCRENKDSVQLTVKEYSDTMATLLKLNKKYNGRIAANAGPLACAKDWKEMELAKKQDKASLPECGYLRSCGGVFDSIAVLANGIIVPCNQLSHITLGRINENSLHEIWTSHPELKRLRERRNIPLSDFKYCNECEYIPYCRGGCPAIAHALVGDENIPAPDACYRMFLKAGGQLP